jgi:hypothetical protein
LISTVHWLYCSFWYVRALERFDRVAKIDSECAMAYWGAAMTYNHPFWDPPSPADETAAWTLVQKGWRHEKLPLAKISILLPLLLFTGTPGQIAPRAELSRRHGSRLRPLSR